jgi:hypothetical protein
MCSQNTRQFLILYSTKSSTVLLSLWNSQHGTCWHASRCQDIASWYAAQPNWCHNPPHPTPPHPTTLLWYRTLTIYSYSHYIAWRLALSAMDMLNICPAFIYILYQDTLLWAFYGGGAEEWRCLDKTSGSWRFERSKYLHLQDYWCSRHLGFLKIRKPIVHWCIVIS